ncbi:MAG: T9SS type A sorting domain-containing protein [Ignavibacteria bacterium]|nr:T9SS type A sorting domain-containing protein [Ignavibacteria bacterium]
MFYLQLSLFLYSLFQSGKNKNRDKISGAYDALNFWSSQRVYPFNDFPDKKYYQEFEKYKANRSLNKYNGTIWETIGPHNTAGRTLCIEFNPQNPNTIYAGSASGGLWRSYTGGFGAEAWEYISTGYPVLGVSSIAISPDDSNTIFIATGEIYNYDAAGTGAAFRNTRGTYGIGILKTTDGGLSWTKSLDWSYNQQRGVWVVRINPLNPNTIWAGTTIGTFKSNDAGETWQQVHNVVMVMDLVINAADTNIVLIGCGNFESTGYGIYRTSDNGSSWTKITSSLPSNFMGKIMLGAYEQNPNIVYASIGNGFSGSDGASWLCKSTDAGETFTVVSTQDYSQHQGWFSHDVAINPNNSSIVIAAGIEAWKSTNGGPNLVRKSNGGVILGKPPIGGPDGPPDYVHSDIHEVRFRPDDPDIVYYGTDGGVFVSLDGGETFQSVNGGYQSVQFYNGFSSSFQDSLFSLGGLQDNSTIIYDGSLAWTRRIGGDGSWTGVNSENDNIVYGSWQFLSMTKSTNRGISFSSIAPPNQGNTAFIAPYVLSVIDPNILYAGRSRVYKSTNGGSGWTATNNNNPLDENPCIALAISYQNSDVVYASTAPLIIRGNIFVTSNGGTSWTNITGNLPDRFPIDLAVDPNDDNIVYVTFSGFDASHFFKSTNSGDEWIDISTGLPDVPTSAVIVDPDYPGHIYIGNDLGVYASTDGGNSWIDFNDGLPDAVIVMDLNIVYPNRKLRVATHGNGAYERDLIGNTLDVEQDKNIIADYSLEQNYPNPFNPTTNIGFRISTGGFISLKVYDVVGKEVTILVNEEKPAGEYEVEFSAKGRSASGGDAYNLSSGIYFYKLEAENNSETKKMVLLR